MPEGKSETTPATCPECGCRNGWHVAKCRTGKAALDVIKAVSERLCK